MKEVLYLDTSALNYLYQHPQRNQLATNLIDQSIIFVSVFTFVELASTCNESYRNGILRFAKNLSGDIKPLALPGTLLKRARMALRERQLEMDNSISNEWDGLWTAYNDPQVIKPEDYVEIVDWKRRQDNWFEQMHVNGRNGVQSELKKTGLGSSTVLRRYSSFVRPIVANEAEIAGHIMSLSPPDDQIGEQEACELGRGSEHWRFLLAGLAYSIHCRGFKQHDYGKKRNPGSIDVQQVVYLAACDRFVTSDVQQYRMIRQIVPFGHKKRRAFLCRTDDNRSSWRGNRPASSVIVAKGIRS